MGWIDIDTAVTDDDLERSIEILEGMRSIAPRQFKGTRLKTIQDTLDVMIEDTRKIIRGEPSIVSREKIERYLKKHYWN